MAEINNNSDKITFKLKHLNKYHEIVIDPNDDRNEYKHQQLFEQLESITGVPSRYAAKMLIIKNETPSPLNNNGRIVWGIFVNSEAMVPESLMEYYPHLMFTAHIQDIFSVNTRNGQRFYLQYGVCYEHQISKRISMCYKLVEERDVPEEGCVGGVCQYQCTESYFRRLKDLVSNDEMNAKITQLVQPLFESGNSAEVYRIFRDFNIKQYLYPSCDEGYRRQLAVNGHAHQIDLYPRTRG